ncbi:MAG: hypothetical protein H7Z41_00435 [Cytophagales bacterium]|nr:hypothetical protein [Armatimonadota bacterium]
MTIVHLTMVSIAIAVSFSMSLGRFDSGAPATLRERAWGGVADLLLFPLYTVSRALNLHLGRLDHLLLFANSLLWGIAIYWLGTALFRRRPRSTPNR